MGEDRREEEHGDVEMELIPAFVFTAPANTSVAFTFEVGPTIALNIHEQETIDRFADEYGVEMEKATVDPGLWLVLGVEFRSGRTR